MQVTESYGYLSDHKLSLIFLEPTVFDKMTEQLTTLNKVHDKEYSILVLENVIHTDYEWMINCIQDLLLQLKRINIFILEHHVLSDTLHGKELLVSHMLHHEYFTKGTFSNHSNDLEVFELGIFFGLLLELKCGGHFWLLCGHTGRHTHHHLLVIFVVFLWI